MSARSADKATMEGLDETVRITQDYDLYMRRPRDMYAHFLGPPFAWTAFA